MRLLLVLLSLAISVNIALAYNYPDNVQSFVEVNKKVYYNPTSSTWARTPLAKGLIFTKHMTVGSGGFSEFLLDKTYYDTNTTLEFYDGNKLLGYNQHELKFYELGFNDNKITRRELSADEVQKLFPDVKIVKVSQFKNNKITLKKPVGKTKTFLILNDTDRDFYKYNYENHGNGTELIKSIVEVSSPKKIVFSHFGSREEDFPILTINIKNGFRCKK